MLEGADDKFGVACLGGECFGEAGAGFLRFSCAEPNDRLQQALDFIPKAIARTDRLAAWLDKNPQYRLASRTPSNSARKARRARTFSYVKPVMPVHRYSRSRGGYCRQVSEIFAPDGFPLNLPGLVPGFFLPRARQSQTKSVSPSGRQRSGQPRSRQ